MSDKNIPRNIGFIMDGNRRWAKDQGLSAMEGHRAGYEKLKEVGEWCLDAGVEFLTIFGFSTENWKRSGEEVNFLMELIHRAVTDELDYFNKKNIRLRVIGREEGMSERLLAAFRNAEKETSANTRGTLSLAINYGGRADILDATKRLIAAGMSPTELTEERFAAELVTNGLPDPDLIVRTSGEQRLSGFLPWQSVYSEIYFEPKHWPALEQADIQRMIASYGDRERRYGK